MVTGTIFDIRRFSTHDGPGIRTTVFFKGCPLNCWWCHNPESQARGPEVMVRANRCIRCQACLHVCPQGALSWNDDFAATDADKCIVCGACVQVCYAGAREVVGREMTADQVLAAIEKDIAFYDESGGGVTFSGGEPLSQPGFLLALLRACKEKGIHTAVDTSGYASWETLDNVREYVDLFLYDLKLMDDAKHRRFTGVSNRPILRNLRLLAGCGHSVFVRLPIIPAINDADENIRQVGDFLSGLPCMTAAGLRLEGPARLPRVDILPYHHAAVEKCRRLGKTYGLPDTRPPSEERMAQIAGILEGFGLHVKIGG